MIYLRQSTASQEVILGPFLDDTDGKTAETALSIANTDIKVWKHGGTSEASKNSGGATHIASGRYYCVLDATDTDTIGGLELNVHVSGALPVKTRAVVLDEAVYDVLFGTTAPSTYAGADTSGTTTLLSRIGSALTITSGRVNADITHIAAAAVSTSTAQLGVNVVNFGGSAGTFASGRPAVNASYIGGVPVTATTSITFPSTCTVATTTGAVGSVTGAVGSVTGAVGSVTGNVGGNVVGSVGSVTGNVGGNVTGSVGSVATGGITASSLAADCITASALAADAVTEIQSGLATAANLSAVKTKTDQLTFTLPNILDANAAAVNGGTATASLLTTLVEDYQTGLLDTNLNGKVLGNGAGTIAGTGVWAAGASGATISTLTAAQVNTEADTALSDVGLTSTITGRIDAAITSRPTLAQILAGGDVDGYTLEQTLKLCLAALAGKVSGGGTTTITIRAADDSKARITATVDADGNRSAITYDAAG